MPIENTPEIKGGTEEFVSEVPVEEVKKNEPEALWEDWNLMPVYKVGIDDKYCTEFHQKGLKQRVYPITKFRADGTVELSGDYCKECIKGFVTDCKSTGGHLE